MFRHQTQSEQAPAEERVGNLPSDQNPESAFIMRLGRALLSLGSPAHRIETILSMVAKRLRLDSQFFSTPTALIASLGNEQQSRTYMVRVESTATDLGKLSDILEVMDKVSDTNINIQQASQEITEIYSSPPRYGSLLTWLAFTLVSASVAIILGGGWNEMFLAALIGSLVGGLNYLGKYFDAMQRLFVPISATIGAIVAHIYVANIPTTNLLLPVIAGLIILIPGMDLTMGTRELASGHLVSGSARVSGAILVLMTILFGMLVGNFVGESMVGAIHSDPAIALDDWIRYLTIAVAAFSFTILFRARARDFVVIMFACYLSIFALKYSQMISSAVVAAAIAAVIVGVCANLFARISNRPSAVIYIPALLLLVPGALGFRSLTEIMQHNVISGLEGFMNVVLTAIALTTGMVISSVLVPSRNEF